MANRIFNRRDFIHVLAAAGLAGCAPARLTRIAEPAFNFDPFALGVASGYPTHDGVVLWTRLMAATRAPLASEDAVAVRWEIAADERMRRIVRSGIAYAEPDFAHSVHVEARGLQSNREYWYRFTAGGMQSVVGRTRTAPNQSASLTRLRVGVVSCQKYENGYYVAYRHLLNEQPDVIVHTGDYIYEYASTPSGDNLRGDGSGETRTLDQYRARYALYRGDADLRAAHAACPWLVTWDDHEVANDYWGDASYEQSGEEFLARRAAAYRAYYEHMPLPRSALPTGPNMQLYARAQFGALLQIHMLDSRQYRSPIACQGVDDTNRLGASCAALFDATRTKLGRQQETWLYDSLAKQSSRWNVLAQGTPMTHVDNDPGPGVAYRRDTWDGYPAARQRLIDALVATRTRNPVVIDGDIHAFQVANIHARANDIDSPIVASEFTTDSITSYGIGQNRLDDNRRRNPNILFADSRLRGYTLLTFTPQQLRADLINVATIRSQDATRSVLASFAVENDRPGPQRMDAGR